ncbi:MAG: hypothetical protein IT439_09870 [Phycisphaerales bacterium]|nr:hypothetical protein [Phycisphaerales bacterium]
MSIMKFMATTDTRPIQRREPLCAALALASVVVMSTPALAQGGSCASTHPTTCHSAVHIVEMQRTALQSNWVEYIEANAEEPVPETLCAYTFEACAGQPLDVSITETFQRTESVSVEGSAGATSSIKLSLAQPLVAEAGASINISAQWNITTTVTITVEQSTVVPACQRFSYQALTFKRTSSGSAVEWASKGSCTDLCPAGGVNPWYGHNWKCGQRIVTGTAVGYPGQSVSHIWTRLEDCTTPACTSNNGD